MSASDIEIHEFSTGITPEQTTIGWVSRGFTGRYMNSTLDEIPYAVERSIANKEFSVAEGASSDRPTIIGREIDEWSIIAIITKGRDEKGRSASFYRYFLSENGNLNHILSWIENEKAHGRDCNFNPYDQKDVRQPNLSEISYPSQSTSRQECSDETPEILNPDQEYSVQQVNELATTKAHRNRQPVSWAYNVEALEQASRFQVIYPASEPAIRRIKQSLVSVNVAPTSAIDEQAINVAIKNLINSSQIKPESVDTLVKSIRTVETALGNQSASFWKGIFDGQGAGNAIRQKILSPQMSKLLTVRAMILPETVLEFLDWLQISEGKQATEQATGTLSLQSQVSKYLSHYPDLEKKLDIGVNFIFKGILDSRISQESAYWLLDPSGSVWKSSTSRVLDGFEEYLSSNQQGRSFDKEVWGPILKKMRMLASQRQPQINNNYLILAELFNNLRRPILSACFYQAGQGVVPREVHDKASSSRNFNGGQPFSVILRKEKSLLDHFFNGISHPITLSIFALFVVVSGIYFASRSFGLVESQGGAKVREDKRKPGNQMESLDSAKYLEIQKKIKDIRTANKKLDSVNLQSVQDNLLAVIDILEKERSDKDSLVISQGSSAIRQDVIKSLLYTFFNTDSLGPDLLRENDIEDILNSKTDLPLKNRGIAQKKLIDAIAFYQSNNDLDIVGNIGENTKRELLSGVRKKLNLPTSNQSKPDPYQLDINRNTNPNAPPPSPNGTSENNQINPQNKNSATSNNYFKKEGNR